MYHYFPQGILFDLLFQIISIWALVLLVYHKLPQMWRLKPTHIYGLSFYGSGEWTQPSWVLCSGAHGLPPAVLHSPPRLSEGKIPFHTPPAQNEDWQNLVSCSYETHSFLFLQG